MVEETPVFTKSYAFLSCFYVFVVFSYSRIRSFQIRHVYTILYIFFDNYTILYASSTLSSPLNSRFVTWCRVIYEIEMREERNVIPSPTIHLSPWQTNCTRRPLSLSLPVEYRLDSTVSPVAPLPCDWWSRRPPYYFIPPPLLIAILIQRILRFCILLRFLSSSSSPLPFSRVFSRRRRRWCEMVETRRSAAAKRPAAGEEEEKGAPASPAPAPAENAAAGPGAGDDVASSQPPKRAKVWISLYAPCMWWFPSCLWF